MSDITVTNKDSTILTALKTALKNAKVNGDAVFAATHVAGSADEARQKKYAQSPVAVVVYEDSEEFVIPDLKRGVDMNATIILAVRGKTETLRKSEITRVKSAAINAINTDVPADAAGFADGEDYHPRVKWGTPETDAVTQQPWAICLLPVTIAYTTTNETSH
ncbi:MAG: hypothetical protein KAV00_06810 [Phycisphaerae bacterium]|nr:hypothetical protein [Phycisphaerae bacterium]